VVVERPQTAVTLHRYYYSCCYLRHPRDFYWNPEHVELTHRLFALDVLWLGYNRRDSSTASSK
jgi:hypothetical protein